MGQNNGGWEDDFPLQVSDFEVPAVNFPRKEAYCRRVQQQVSESFALNFKGKNMTTQRVVMSLAKQKSERKDRLS